MRRRIMPRAGSSIVCAGMPGGDGRFLDLRKDELPRSRYEKTPSKMQRRQLDSPGSSLEVPGHIDDEVGGPETLEAAHGGVGGLAQRHDGVVCARLTGGVVQGRGGRNALAGG